ncbi:hypothetical protein WG622_13475 [Cognatishimia sp. D5M38]|uniref:Uncharacterized protein n=1 Tax=Cognatishimia coralii TaxID=3083254 RepID=A0ABU8QIL0_9RHOB
MEVLLIVGSLVAFLLFIALRDILRDRRKWKTMRQNEDGTWSWTDRDGSTQTSMYRPHFAGDTSYGGGSGNFGAGDGSIDGGGN